MEETDLNEFLVQADQYRDGGDAADMVFKVLNLLGATHPFHVLRAAELRDWIEAGEYDRVLRGEYRHRTDGAGPYKEDLAAARRRTARTRRSRRSSPTRPAFSDREGFRAKLASREFGSGRKRCANRALASRATGLPLRALVLCARASISARSRRA
jgi:hypothetical protein